MGENVPLVDSSRIVDEVRTKRGNQEWLDQHRADLRKRFPNQYVAVLNQQPVYGDKDFRTLLSRLKRDYPGTDLSLAAIELIGEDDFVWVL